MPDRRGNAYKTPRGLEYERYINSRAWQKKKAQYWDQAGRVCKVKHCEATDNLHVHHHTYDRLGRELMHDLVGLCETHHHAVHDLYDSTPALSLTRATEMITGLALRSKKVKVSEVKKVKKVPAQRVSGEPVSRSTARTIAELHKTTKPKTHCSCTTCKPPTSVPRKKKKPKRKVDRKPLVAVPRRQPWEARLHGMGRYELVGQEGVFKKDVGVCICGRAIRRGAPVRVVRLRGSANNHVGGAARAITGSLALQRVDCPCVTNDGRI